MQTYDIKIDLSGKSELFMEYPAICILKSYDDLVEYREGPMSARLKNDVRKFLKSPCPDHENYGAEVSTVVYLDHRKGESPLIAMDRHITESEINKLEKIHDGYHVIVNNRGGWFPIDPSKYIILDASIQSPHMTLNVKHVAGARYIVLENDDKIDPIAVSELGKMNVEKYSTITNLGSFSQQELTEVLNSHVHRGGFGVYLYTQANDLRAVKLYCSAIHDSLIHETTVGLAVPLEDRREALTIMKHNIRFKITYVK